MQDEEDDAEERVINCEDLPLDKKVHGWMPDCGYCFKINGKSIYAFTSHYKNDVYFTEVWNSGKNYIQTEVLISRGYSHEGGNTPYYIKKFSSKEDAINEVKELKNVFLSTLSVE